ncbi:MAG: O-antigen biosynthesis alpha,3-abequosyltransferase [Methanothermococcus sp.]|uniref:glycosyltransferase family 2 protein n=1 Tax=Methanothermococcus sp. TaxID=2614238 RepID=UPI00258747E7|nr:glycosyltransferase family 2 protein [Methanothermococcus sp.]MDK2789584.1 O-antigen biosynthesis alpha,3-abequosyltransferase [Methanothermococcus sp.]
MTNKPLLSICIPTYNRAEFLKDALNSILRQINTKNKDKVEICISDNASEDNTEELVKEYQKKSSIPIIYHKNEKNMGADYNYLKVVEIANGEYCWLLGSDDIIEDGGIDNLLKEIKENKDIDIFIVKQKGYDCELKNKINLRSPLINDDGNDVLFNNSVDALNRVELWDWGYISAMVINRKKWLSIKGYEKWIGSAYVHVYIIYSLIKQGSKVKFLNKYLVGWRSGNDSFLNELKIYGRFKIDLNYVYIAEDVFGKNSKECNIVKNMLINTPVLSGRIINAKLNCLSYDIYIKMFKDIYPIGRKYLRFWIWYIPLFLTPSFIYKIVRPIVKEIKNIKHKIRAC